jgi:hypothetical protein
MLKLLYTSVTKRATLMRRSTVPSVSILLVFPGLTPLILLHFVVQMSFDQMFFDQKAIFERYNFFQLQFQL